MLKRFGIIAPTEAEASLLLDRLSPDTRVLLQGKGFFISSYAGYCKVTVCICGIGKANAAHSTTLLIEKFGPEFICLLGVGGAYPSSGLALGDMVVAEREVYGDEGMESPLGFVSMQGLGLPLLADGFLTHFNEMPLTVPDGLPDGIRAGTFVTVSSCTGTFAKGIEMERRFPNALCENMEGAAFAHVCAINRVPAAELRAVSNIIEDRTSEGLNRDDIMRASLKVQGFFLEKMPRMIRQ